MLDLKDVWLRCGVSERITTMDEPDSEEKKLVLSLAENLTQVQMTNSDTVKVVTDLYNIYADYVIVEKKFGITEKMANMLNNGTLYRERKVDPYPQKRKIVKVD